MGRIHTAGDRPWAFARDSMSPILHLQRRMMELGRCRLGTKGTKGEPKRLDTFRWTSGSRALLEAIATSDGGAVQEWQDAPDEGMFEVVTERNAVDIIIPPVFSASDGTPTTPYSQWFELWSAAGCQRRCDGQTEALSGKPCLCAGQVEAEGEEARECKVTTRFSFMRPDIPGLGVWRLESHGWNSAVELPGTLEVMMLAAAESKFIPAVLRIEHRTKKQPGQPIKKFIVPVIDLPGVTVNQLVSGDIPLAINAPATSLSQKRPALPAGPPPPEDSKFNNGEQAAHGAPPPLPETSPVQGPPDGEKGTASSEAQAGTGGAGPEWAKEADVTQVLELAARVGDTEYTKTVDAIAKHRAKFDDKVNGVWLGKLTTALLKKAPAAEPEQESMFKAPAGAIK